MTISTLPASPSRHEVYAHIRAYFSRPGARLARHEGTCVYWDREGDGAKCAVGCLLSDKLLLTPVEINDEETKMVTLHERIEENVVEDIATIPLIHDLLNGETEEGQRKLEFLKMAQRAHDAYAEDAQDFVRLLDLLADAAGLHVPVSYRNGKALTRH